VHFVDAAIERGDDADAASLRIGDEVGLGEVEAARSRRVVSTTCMGPTAIVAGVSPATLGVELV